MPPTLEQYLILSKQEHALHLEANPPTLLDKLQTALHKLTSNDPKARLTDLERTLLADNETFTSPLVHQYGQFITVKQVDDDSPPVEVYRVNIPAKDRSKPTYVFIHGLGGTLQQFDLLFSELAAKGFGILAFDQPGFGLSHSEKDITEYRITLDRLTLLTKQVIQVGQIQSDDICLVGHSFGTQILIDLIANHEFNGKDKVRKIWLLTPPETPKVFKFAERLLLNLFYYQTWIFDTYRHFDRQGNIHSGSLKRLVAFLESDGEGDEDLTGYYKLKQLKYNLTTNSVNFLNQLSSWKTLTLNDLHRFKQALLQRPSHIIKLVIVDGKHDHVTRQSGLDLNDRLDNIGEYVLLDGGHVIMIDHHKDVLNLLLLDEAL